MTNYKLRVRQGRLLVTANSEAHALSQARAFERDAQRYWVRAQCHVKGDLFALGAAAWEEARCTT